MPSVVVSGISFGFPRLSRCEGQIAHVLLTRSPLVYPQRGLTARLACVKHAASVRPEPGSNSPTKTGPTKTLHHRDGAPNAEQTSNWHNTTSPNTKLDTLLSSQKTPAHRRRVLWALDRGSCSRRETNTTQSRDESSGMSAGL